MYNIFDVKQDEQDENKNKKRFFFIFPEIFCNIPTMRNDQDHIGDKAKYSRFAGNFQVPAIRGVKRYAGSIFSEKACCQHACFSKSISERIGLKVMNGFGE